MNNTSNEPPLLQIGGLMVFDDYFANTNDPQSIKSPKVGIDTFMQLYSGSLEVVSFGYQLALRKIAN